jgi:hypothetical protein
MVLTSSPTPDGAIYAYDHILKLGYCRCFLYEILTVVAYTKHTQ